MIQHGFAVNTLSNDQAFSQYMKTFGKLGIGEEHSYYDPARGVDMRKAIGEAIYGDGLKEYVQKGPSIGNTTGGTFTEYGLMPSFIDPSIVDRTMVDTPLVRLLPRRASRGRSYVYDAVTAKVLGKFLGDDAPLNDFVDTRTTTATQMKYLYAVGRVTGPALASAQGFINLFSEDLRVKLDAMNEALENEIVNGNTSTNANGFDGLRTSISTNSTSNAGAAITLELVEEDCNTVFEANGRCDLIVTDGYTYNILIGLLRDFQRNIEQPSADMSFGIPEQFMFNGIRVVKTRKMPTTAGSREILYLDTRYVFLAVLQEMTYVELAKMNDSDKYFLKWYGSLVVTAEGLMAKRTSLA